MSITGKIKDAASKAGHAVSDVKDKISDVASDVKDSAVDTANKIVDVATGKAVDAGFYFSGKDKRRLTDEEWSLANELFDQTLPDREHIILTNASGTSGRAFVVPTIGGKDIYVNLGSGYKHPLSYTEGKYSVPGQIFIHEMTHVWQIHHNKWDAGFICKRVADEVTGISYEPGAGGKSWGSYNIEQQAEIVASWYAEKRSPYHPFYHYIIKSIRKIPGDLRTLDPRIFDPKFYVEYHQDLMEALGAEIPDRAASHWLRWGLQEGRRSSSEFDVAFYLSSNQDLIDAFGPNNYQAAALHWLDNGIREGRRGSKEVFPKTGTFIHPKTDGVEMKGGVQIKKPPFVRAVSKS